MKILPKNILQNPIYLIITYIKQHMITRIRQLSTINVTFQNYCLSYEMKYYLHIDIRNLILNYSDD